MATAPELIAQAFERLSQRPGFTLRADQRQLALLLSDLIDERESGAFEAPTGLGKSLASLLPAIAHGAATGKRTVIATYTNVLAEQYWSKDLPLAMELMEEPAIRTQLLMGRSRYTCLAALDEHAPDVIDDFRRSAEMGTENEFRRYVRKPSKEMTPLWQKVASPPVCPGRHCPVYDDCFYYSARRKASLAHVVITNHSVVIQDALMKSGSDDAEGLLGKYDFLILDEAHDFPQAAVNGLEFEVSAARLSMLAGIVTRLEASLLSIAQRRGDEATWTRLAASFRDFIERRKNDLAGFEGRSGILIATPNEVMEHPMVKQSAATDRLTRAYELTSRIADACTRFVKAMDDLLDKWKESEPEAVRAAIESTSMYPMVLREYAIGCLRFLSPDGVAVSYVGQSPSGPYLRQDLIDLADPLKDLLWNNTPYACLSATLAVDEKFEFFKRVTGVEPKFEEVLPSPFDHASQAALYLPEVGRIPDPTVARREDYEAEYYAAVAREIGEIIRLCGGRTLALFHSRKEMEAVHARMNLPPEFPIYTQTRFGTSTIGDRFKRDVHASLFGLRSFWTGFDAPGETLSCVVLVRVPFEVPVDPPQIARLAYLQTQEKDAFFEHTLPNAKMMMRQGAGRLIRRDGDHGVIAILDPRVQTKPYGEEILGNLPPEMRMFRDFADAAGWVGLEGSQETGSSQNPLFAPN